MLLTQESARLGRSLSLQGQSFLRSGTWLGLRFGFGLFLGIVLSQALSTGSLANYLLFRLEGAGQGQVQG